MDYKQKCAKYNIEYKEYELLLQKRLTTKRFYHSLCVADEAVRLADKYGCDTKKAYLAGLLHDITKDNSNEEQLQLMKKFGIIASVLEKNAPKLWHAMTGSAYVKNVLKIDDIDITNAIRYHTTAKADMSLLSKILYLADFTSSDRDYDDVDEMRKAVETGIDNAMFYALDYSVKDLQSSGREVHPDTLAAYYECCKRGSH